MDAAQCAELTPAWWGFGSPTAGLPGVLALAGHRQPWRVLPTAPLALLGLFDHLQRWSPGLLGQLGWGQYDKPRRAQLPAAGQVTFPVSPTSWQLSGPVSTRDRSSSEELCSFQTQTMDLSPGNEHCGAFFPRKCPIGDVGQSGRKVPPGLCHAVLIAVSIAEQAWEELPLGTGEPWEIL